MTVHAPALILWFWACCRASTAQHKAKALRWLSDGPVPDGERARQINLDIKVSIIPEYPNINLHESAELLLHSLQRMHNYYIGYYYIQTISDQDGVLTGAPEAHAQVIGFLE